MSFVYGLTLQPPFATGLLSYTRVTSHGFQWADLVWYSSCTMNWVLLDRDEKCIFETRFGRCEMQEIRSNIWLIGLCLLGGLGALISFRNSPARLSESPRSPSDTVLQAEPAGDGPLGSTDQALFLVDNVQGNSLAETAKVPSHIVDLTEPLRRLHDTTLIAFEFAPNFGHLRMPPVIQESTPPQHVPLLASESETLIESLGETASVDPKPDKAWYWINEMTGLCSQGFVYRPTKVSYRKRMAPRNDWVDRLVYGYPDPKSQSTDAFADEFPVLKNPTELWRVSSIELIGLWQRESPVVFEQRPSTGFAVLNTERVPTRNVNREESAAVPKLQGDVQLIATFDEEDSKIRLVGAIRAKQSCTHCHDTTEGSLLGAFTYSIEPRQWPEDLAAK